METQKKTFVKTDIDKELEQFIKENTDVLYKRQSEEFGKRVDEGNKDKKFTVDGKFTKVKKFAFIFSI